MTTDPRALLRRVPAFAWLALALALTLPWYLAYFALVLRRAGVVAFWMPMP